MAERVIPGLECLEDRLTPYSVTSYQWPNLNISASFVPDMTAIGDSSADLFTKYDSRYDTAAWQREFARALQTWATVTPLNFRVVNDSGAISGALGSVQGDSQFGDIRLGAYESTSQYLAYSYYPYANTTKAGDIILNSRTIYNLGTHFDLYSVLVHEVGHALGLGHSAVPGSVMYASVTKAYAGAYAGLTADDVTGIQAAYGARTPDAYDARAANNRINTSTNLATGGGAAHAAADLTSIGDVDFYRIRIPKGAKRTATVSVDARDLSLLMPKVSVYNSSKKLVANASVTTFGSVATVTLRRLVPGQRYYIAADGATKDPFGMGSYRLDVQFGGSPPRRPPSRRVRYPARATQRRRRRTRCHRRR